MLYQQFQYRPKKKTKADKADKDTDLETITMNQANYSHTKKYNLFDFEYSLEPHEWKWSANIRECDEDSDQRGWNCLFRDISSANKEYLTDYKILGQFNRHENPTPIASPNDPNINGDHNAYRIPYYDDSMVYKELLDAIPLSLLQEVDKIRVDNKDHVAQIILFGRLLNMMVIPSKFVEDFIQSRMR
jgi:hypothetical protein